MSSTDSLLQSGLLDGVEQVVAEPLRFKAKLAIGEAAYTSLRTVNLAREAWDVLGSAATGAAVAKSGLVASTFFAPSGLLGALGIGAAATPIGWVAFAALASGGACYGLYRVLGNSKGSRVIEIPRFLNTPLDTLGLAIFDLMTPLALRLAAVDGQVDAEEWRCIGDHLVEEWGLDPIFVAKGIASIAPRALSASVEELATELGSFLSANPDCNHRTIAQEFGVFLEQMLESAGPLEPAERQALDLALKAMQRSSESRMSQSVQATKELASGVGRTSAEAFQKATGWAANHLGNLKARIKG